MKTYNFNPYVKNIAKHGLLLLFFIIMSDSFIGGANASASGDPAKYRESGELTEIESDTAVIIDERGYAVHPSIFVVDVAGKPTSLDKLTLPADVSFEYSYMKTAPQTISAVIVYIEELKKNGSKGRSMQ